MLEEPLYPVEEIYGLHSFQPQKSIQHVRNYSRLTDGSRFQEFKSNLGKNNHYRFCSYNGI
jgi:acetyl-CoA carboxylase carboxyltransferase component